MTQCITDYQSKKFLNFLKTKGVNIHAGGEYFHVYGPKKTGRTLTSEANRLVKVFLPYIKSNKNFPFFFPLNLVLDPNGNKHAVMLGLSTPMGKEKNKQYRIEIFEPNGKYEYEDYEEKDWEWYDHVGYNITVLLNRTAQLMSEKLKTIVNVVEVRDGDFKGQLNSGGGHCDAISLYYVWLRSVGGYSLGQTNVILGEKKLNKTNTENINKFIVSNGKKGGLNLNVIKENSRYWRF
jgi:hypothetical protein